MEDLLALLAEIEAFRDAFFTRIEKDFEVASRDMYAEVIAFAATLNYATPGSPLTDDQKIANRQAIQAFRSVLVYRVTAGRYGVTVQGIVESLDATIQKFEGYFGKVSVSFRPDTALYRQIVDSGRERVVQQLVGSGVDSGYTGPVVNLLDRYVAGGQSLAQITKNLKDEIVTVGRSTRWATQIANDAVEFTTADYIQTVSGDIGLEHYLYQGTLITTSRQFCQHRAGKAYTKKEVESWPELNWSGKIPGTDKKTIFIFRGGYRCRHQLLPISKEMYDYINSEKVS